MKKCAPSFPKLEKEKFGAQRKIWILEEKFGINCDLRWIIWNKLFFGRGPIWHREGYYIGNDGPLGEMGWDLSREMTGTF